MDRVFFLQKEYVENRHNPDGLIYRHILEQFKNINLDEVYVCDSDIFTVDNTIIRNAKKMKKKIIPVGTLEFVQLGLNNIAEKPVYMKPIEIPNVPKMLKYAKRGYKLLKGADITDEQLKKNPFIKDAVNLKKWNNLLNDYTDRSEIDEDTLYVVSERVEFLSEYRMFIHKGEVLAVQNYLGNAKTFPDSMSITNMIDDYESTPEHPESYTMDIGVIYSSTRMKTALIEIHPFTSCGLYGFYDRDIPDMLENGIKWYLEQDSKTE